jgi:hypothetical protein
MTIVYALDILFGVAFGSLLVIEVHSLGLNKAVNLSTD